MIRAVASASTEVGAIEDILRLLVVVFLALHGFGHIIWFLAAWTHVKAGIGDGPWLLPGDYGISSIPGRALGLLALFVLLLFLLSSVALLASLSWWRGSAQIAALLSLVSVSPFGRISPRGNTINAILGDLAVMFFVALPVSVELTVDA